jgi:hypothetical protein
MFSCMALLYSFLSCFSSGDSCSFNADGGKDFSKSESFLRLSIEHSLSSLSLELLLLRDAREDLVWMFGMFGVTMLRREAS